MTEEPHYYTYMLRCSDGSLYTGWTTDLKKRLQAHNRGTGARYTRSRQPVELVWSEEHPSKADAMSREWHIKKMSRKQKEELLADQPSTSSMTCLSARAALE